MCKRNSPQWLILNSTCPAGDMIGHKSCPRVHLNNRKQLVLYKGWKELPL